MKVLLLAKYTRIGASSRLRSLQYLDYLVSAGLQVESIPLLGDSYVAALQQGRTHLAEVVLGYTRRLIALLQSRAYDVIWIEKECLPWMPVVIEHLLLPARVPYVLDFDDAIFHAYDLHSNAGVRLLLGNKIPRLMRNAALVLAGNGYLAQFASNSGARNVEILPTAIDLSRYPVRPRSCDASPPPIVGWIGQRSTAHFLAPLKGLMTELDRSNVARFTAIGIQADRLGLPMSSIPWAEDREVASLLSFDIGIMPLADGPFERGKCGYKLIQYMACGLPVVASPVGVNAELVEHGVNGFLAASEAEWVTAIRTLAADPHLRARMGEAGRRKVEQRYCTRVTGPTLLNLLKSAARKAV